jgi:uncharacterized membrane protein
MAQAAKKKPVNAKAAARAPVKSGPNWPLFVLASIGILLSGYLTYTAWQEKLVAGCAVGSACDVVLNSRWSTLFGMPTSFWGLLAYASLAAIAWNKATDLPWKAAWLVSLFGLFYSLYLTAVSFFALNAACPYCLTSLGLMTLIFITVTWQKPANLPGFAWGPWLAKTMSGAVVAVLALHLYYAGYWGKAPGPEDPWVRGLAEHLTKTSAKFYGAYWCPHCVEQKELFGASVKRIPYIECSPSGPNAPQATECKEKDIKSYPTWVINGTRYSGTLSLDTLAQHSNYKYPQGGKP